MGDAGNAFALLGCRGGHERTGCGEQDLPHRSRLERREKMAAQQAGAASAAGTAGVGVLCLRVVEHCAAVLMIPGDVKALFHHQIAEQFAAHDAQIAGDDGVILFRRSLGGFEIAHDGIRCRRRHGCAHMVGVGHAQIHHNADAGTRDAHPVRNAVRLLENHSARSGTGPLRRRRPLTAVGERKPKLALCRGKMGRSHCRRIFAHAACRQKRRRQQSLCHSGTRPVDAQQGNLQRAHSIGGADALVHEIAGADAGEVAVPESGLFQRQLHRAALHDAFRLFPGLLSEMGVGFYTVETAAHGTVALFLTHGAGVADDAGRLGILKNAPGKITYHSNHLDGSISGTLGIMRVRMQNKIALPLV